MNEHHNNPHKIVIVGGGAGGLALATRLGRKLGKRQRAQITLIDGERTHIWKPLLHEVAAGTLNTHEDEINYLAQASWNYFKFRLGRVNGLNRETKTVSVAPVKNEHGEAIMPGSEVPYDTLVFAVGSISNDFGVEGVRENCLFLDTTLQARSFQTHFLDACLKAHSETKKLGIDISIVGGGATGVELCAQLYDAAKQFTAYGLDAVNPETDIRITLIEGANRILPALPERLSSATTLQLQKLGINVLTDEQVVSVSDKVITTRNGKQIHADIAVWAAGIKAPEFLKEIDGLETNKINQLVVEQTLKTTQDENIFAMGDCAQVNWIGHEGNVPPRAQSAGQQAGTLAKTLIKKLRNEAPVDYHYKDYGSLVSLGKYSTVGNLMGNLMGSVMLEGFVARLTYLSLYKKHQVALLGIPRVVFLTISHLFRHAAMPRIKLH